MAEKKVFHVRDGYVWVQRDADGVERPMPDMREVKLDPDGPEFRAQKHKLVEFAPRDAKPAKASEGRGGKSPQDRMVDAPNNR